MVRIGGKGAAATLAMALALGLAACGGYGGTSSSTGTGIEDAKPVIIYSVSGGLAGIAERLQILSDRSAILTSGVGPGAAVRSPAKFELTDAQFAGLRKALEAAKLDSLPKLAPSGCADCFEYTIDYAGVHYAADESNLPNRLRPVITTLNDLIAAHGKDGGASVLGGK